jgi:hypothetical protein
VCGCPVFPSVPALCSTHSAAAEAALFAGFFSRMAESDFSGPCIIGFGSSPSRCVPARYSGWSDPRSPGSRARSVRTCQVLRPRRVGRALALTRSSMLSSANGTASTPGIRTYRGCCGRDGNYFPPPAQIPACGFPAPGSSRKYNVTDSRDDASKPVRERGPRWSDGVRH